MPLIRCRRFYCYFDDAKISVYFYTAKYYSKKIDVFLNILLNKISLQA